MDNVSLNSETHFEQPRAKKSDTPALTSAIASSSRSNVYEHKLVIEIFSGTGKLTAAVRKIGVRGLAIDKTKKRALGATTLLDLTLQDDLAFLLEYIDSEKDSIELIHLAPPCGTSSASRNKPQNEFPQPGLDAPARLRDFDEPDGLHCLAGLDKHRVQVDNSLYRSTKRIVLFALERNIRVTIENPKSSLFWHTTPIRELLEIHPGHFNYFHACMMGSTRDKVIAWWCSDDFFAS